MFLKYCEESKGGGAEILKYKGQGTARVVAFWKSKIVVCAALQNWFFVFFSLNPALSHKSEGTKDSCIPLVLQWKNLEQESVQQQRFTVFLPNLNLWHSVSTVLLHRVYCCEWLFYCATGPLLVTSRSLIYWVSDFLWFCVCCGPVYQQFMQQTWLL